MSVIRIIQNDSTDVVVVPNPALPAKVVSTSPVVPTKIIRVYGAKGDKGDKGDGIDQVINETPGGLVNGINATFTTGNSFIPESVDVSINGLKQKPVTHFNTSGNTTITFLESPQSDDQILVNYTKQS